MTEKRLDVNSIDDLFIRNEIIRLYEENEQLKARIEYLERKIQRERTSAMKEHEKWEKEAETKIKELSEENEWLNKEMGDLGTAHAEEITKIEDEFDEEILKLEKENEQLKKEILWWKYRCGEDISGDV